MKVRVINDRTGWTAVVDVPDDRAVLRMPFIDYEGGGFGEALYKPSGERDAQGLPIFRTRAQ